MVTDRRIYNVGKFRPSLQHKLRIVNPGNKTGVTYAITVPRVIATSFENTFFRVTQSGTSIIMESGCKIGPKDIKNVKTNEFNGLRMIFNEYGQPEWIK